MMVILRPRSHVIIPLSSKSFSVVVTVELFVRQRPINCLTLVTICPLSRCTMMFPKPTLRSFHEARKSRSIHRCNRLEDVFQTQWSVIVLYKAIQPIIVI